MYLKIEKTSELSELCRTSKEPVFITKNGYGDMVIMSMETYEKTMFMNDVYHKLEQGERSIEAGEVMDGILPEQLPHVFERGVSGDGGTGLGLTICRNVAGLSLGGDDYLPKPYDLDVLIARVEALPLTS